MPWKIGPIGRGKGKSVYVAQHEGLRKFQDGVKSQVNEQNPEMVEGPFRMEIFFWRRIEEYETPQSRTARNHEADATNMQKGFEDALHNVLFRNDVETRDIRSVVVEQNMTTDGMIIFSIEPISLAELEDSVRIIPDSIFNDPNQPLLEFNEKGYNAWPPVS